MNISTNDIKKQYLRVKKAGWLPAIISASFLSGTTTAHWLAFGSRESNLKNIRGDYRNGRWNGFGPVQVDVGTDPIFAANWRADSIDSVARGFKRGAEIYNLKKNQILGGRGNRILVRGRYFTGKMPVSDDDLRRLSTASYNCGLWSYYHWSRGENCDSTTTGKDYSRDVYDRAIEFAMLLEADGTEIGAVEKEIRLQGKYARAEALRRSSSPFIVKNVSSLPVANAMDSQVNLGRSSYAAEENLVIDENLADERKPAKEKEIDSEKIIAVPQVIPEKEPEKEVSGIKASLAGAITFITTTGAGLLSWFSNAKWEIVAVLAAAAGLIGLVFIIGRFLYANREKQRGFEARMMREKQAFELQLLTLQSAMNSKVNTVGIAPREIKNSEE